MCVLSTVPSLPAVLLELAVAGGNIRTVTMPELLPLIQLTTDIDNYPINKKASLFKELAEKTKTGTGTLSKENRFVIQKLYKAFVDICSENANLTTQVQRLTTENEELVSKHKSPLAYSNQNHQESYSNIVKNTKSTYPVIISDKTGTNLNIEDEVCKKLKPNAKDIDFVQVRKRDEKLIINTKNEFQQKLMIEKLKEDNRFECKLPSKLIPAILIKKISKKLSEEDILNEICLSEDISKENSKIKLLPSNASFRTNRAVLTCTKDDTLKIKQRNEIKIGFMVHPITMIYNVIQCYSCHGFNHFEFNKDKTTRTCKSLSKCGYCASDDHKYNTCPHKNDTKKAKCCNCGGNHPSNYKDCKKRNEIIQKIKIKYIC